ncbi:UNVERIFIED_ORG: sn-glycerol-3-phosphate ABC transporter ATP-binding protein UgpC [Shinella sp. XGS7]|nr:sn-glycerol-3-phosphate ABC transporter ATP-binding protein UgpC [Shinella sp. XGS7]
MGALTISQVRKSYGALEILKDINLEIEQGGFLVLVGPSGCGKSTLLNTIAGLEPISSGDIAIDGRSVAGLHPSKRDIAMVFQSYALYPNMTVAGNIAFGMEIRGVAKEERDKAIKQVADMLQIGHLLDRKPGQLSGGQRQRVAMGRALVRDPKLFLFDEPLSNLDAKLRIEMRTEIKRLHQRTGTTTVYVTHDQVEAMTLGDRIAVLKDGVLQQFGTPVELYDRPANLFVAKFIGSPPMNFLNASRSANGLQAGAQALPLSSEQQAALAERGAAAPQALLYGLRPEHLRLADQGLAGQLRMIEPTGPETYALVETALGQLTVRIPGTLRMQVGENVNLAWEADAAHLFDAEQQRRIA